MKQHLFLFGVQLLITGIQSKTCNTPGCAAFADMVIESMNPEADPCNDFYEYACGRWEAKNPIPENRQYWNVHLQLQELTVKRVMDMWKNDTSDTSEAFKKARKMYRSCMDTDAIEKDAMKTIISLMDKIGGWPMMMPPKTWNRNATSLSKLLIYHGGLSGRQTFFSTALSEKNAPAKMLTIDCAYSNHLDGMLMMSDGNFSTVDLYESRITEIVKIFAKEAGNQINLDLLERDVQELAFFELALAQILPETRLTNKNRTGEVMTIHDLQSWYTGLSASNRSEAIEMSWLPFLQTILNGTGIGLTVNHKVLFMVKDYTQELIRLLDKTPFRTIVNYVQWNFVQNIISGALKDFKDMSLELKDMPSNHSRSSERKELNRHAQCVVDIFPHAVAYEFGRRYSSYNLRRMIQTRTKDLVKTAHELLNATLWLTPPESNYLRNKLQTMEISIGYQDWYDEEPFAVDEYYEECNMGDNYVENVLEWTRCKRIIRIREIARQSKKEVAELPGITATAFYRPFFNSVYIGAASLQAPEIDAGYPRVLQYAALGTLISHEISHAFNPSVIERNQKYLDLLAQWFPLSELDHGIPWSDQSRAKFESKVNCFVEQYNGYEIYRTEDEIIYTNGSVTKEENMSDCHGVRLAYRAFEGSRNSKDTVTRLPRLKAYTDEQLFFLAYASMLCSSMRPEYYEKMAQISYSIDKLRVIGPLSNMEEFSAAFNCPTTKSMNPKRKCGVWGTYD